MLLRLIFLFCMVLQACPVLSAVSTLDLATRYSTPVGEHLSYLQEKSAELDIDEVRLAYKEGRFAQSEVSVLNFGIGARPVWLVMDVRNRGAPTTRLLSVETSWLDRLNVYFVSEGAVVSEQRSGDRQSLTERAIISRYHDFEYQFPEGDSQVFIRVQTPDPMVLPVYLSTVDGFYSRRLTADYSYGFLYGALFILLAYNLMLYLSLRSIRYVLYASYLGAFLLMNLSYTGHAYRYIWPGAPSWQQWSNPLLMVIYAMSGLVFALNFLSIRRYYPSLYRSVIYGCGFVVLLQAVAIVFSSQVASLLIAFPLIFIFTILMVFLGGLSYVNGHKSAKYFLVASIVHAFGASITAAVVWGMMPYSHFAYRAVEVGVILEAILLATALADQFRIIQEEKLSAERLAQLDPLTLLNNRRAFYQFVEPIWANSARRGRASSVVLIDIDKFKSINDRFGHGKGDEVIVSVANTLKRELRTGDVLARWGGEEFIVFLTETTFEEAVRIADRFQHEIGVIEYVVNGEVFNITVSVGVAVNENSSGQLDKLILTADKYLYSAKAAGRDRVVADFA